MTRATGSQENANAVAIIPARFASTRFPGKPLARETGKFLIQHVYERVVQAKRISKVLVATDDQRIFDAVRSFGGLAVMTRTDHPTGTDRLAEVAAGLSDDLIVNVQGDEPEIDPADLDVLVSLIAQAGSPVAGPAPFSRDTEPRSGAGERVAMATLACPYPPDQDIANPNLVKVVLDRSGRAMYFSRSPIPFIRDANRSLPLGGGQGRGAGPEDGPAREGVYLLHRGLYAYKREFLLKFPMLAPGRLEQLEKLEQLRALEHGYAIAVGVVGPGPAGIDTPGQYAEFVTRMSAI